jgi:hypothetical protein
VKYCENKSYGDIIQNDVTFHLFPNDENVIDKWIQSLLSNRFETGFSKVEDIKITKGSYICSDHFEQDCFFQRQGCARSQNHRRLKKDAVPTIFKIKVNCYKLLLQNAVCKFLLNLQYYIQLNTLSQENGFTTCGLDLPRRKVLTAIPHTALHNNSLMSTNKTITSVREQNSISTNVSQVYLDGQRTLFSV